MAKTISELAAEANGFLESAKRDDGTRFVRQKDGCPEWVDDLCRAAHGNAAMLPDDWRYEFIEDALTAVENDDEDFPDVDSLYPYTHDRLAWLASRNDRSGYCDEAAEEMGSTTGKVEDLIAWGMAHELREVHDQVTAFLAERQEELDAEDEPTELEAE